MASLVIDSLVVFYYGCVMYCTLYQTSNSRKHIKLKQRRSAINGLQHALPCALLGGDELRIKDTTAMFSTLSFVELWPKASESWPQWESTTPLAPHSLTSSCKVILSSSYVKTVSLKPSTLQMQQSAKEFLASADKWKFSETKKMLKKLLKKFRLK